MPNFLKNSYTTHSIICFQPIKDQNFKEGLEESPKYKAFNSLGYVMIACGVWDEKHPWRMRTKGECFHLTSRFDGFYSAEL